MSHIAEFMKKNPGLSRSELADKFNCSKNNITNVKNRYGLEYPFGKQLKFVKTNKQTNKQTIESPDNLKLGKFLIPKEIVESTIILLKHRKYDNSSLRRLNRFVITVWRSFL
jgi:hypothetical protein